ncbi:polysaccharide deacetylase family protein [Kitasatospora purpeofusca]|uniref:polysaccharide deacetylase family protein n=1 Tax=Kitasatospora purpeofusca TaxID=67352 RepID=UPI0022510EE2|nr:polysaccharide deacetylase family protein [Kitasatospora purpeofusca]MCX4758819.1 polysaccharide deacetylase family protein [Kitasatospora purpeofusca]WSR30754.1 polysaccharide deacetylase family protein [Kitasatospora purpeofusca]WSR38993.1 polysaccharide deacetylase family protein [Kitasatospora purpeofusca]
MLSDRQITSRRLLLVAAGMSLLGVAGCGRAEEVARAAAAARSAGPDPLPGEPPADGPPTAPAPGPSAEPSPAPSAAAPSASAAPASAPSPAAASPSAPPAGAAPARALTEAESRPVYELDADRRVVALTIDDGPDPRHTPTVLALLEQHGIRATFFLIGENAVEHPDLVREIAARGHHIANHTWTHPDLRRLSGAKVREELERTSELLHRTTGKAPSWFRAPGGDWSPASLKVSAELGMRPMAWSVDPRDWARPGTVVITDRILKDVRPGSIVLNHDGGGDRSQTVAALKAYLPVLIDSGYHFTAPPG